jgi:hypothetical protein
MRAQIRMGESIMILVIFFLLLIFGLVFYVKFKFSSISQSEVEGQELRAIQSVQKVQYLPEVQCTESGNVDYSCVDLLKLDALRQMHVSGSRLSLAYETMFPRTLIKVKQLYPTEQEWEIYGKTLDEDETKFRIPVTIHDAIADKYNFGYIEVVVYS